MSGLFHFIVDFSELIANLQTNVTYSNSKSFDFCGYQA